MDSPLESAGGPPRVVRWHRINRIVFFFFLLLYHNLQGRGFETLSHLFENVRPSDCSLSYPSRYIRPTIISYIIVSVFHASFFHFSFSFCFTRTTRGRVWWTLLLLLLLLTTTMTLRAAMAADPEPRFNPRRGAGDSRRSHRSIPSFPARSSSYPWATGCPAGNRRMDGRSWARPRRRSTWSQVATRWASPMARPPCPDGVAWPGPSRPGTRSSSLARCHGTTAASFPAAVAASATCTRICASSSRPLCRCAWAAACTCSRGVSPCAASTIAIAPRSMAVSRNSTSLSIELLFPDNL